jgi:hypothetical protein
MVIGPALSFLRARALQAPLTFCGLSALAAGYGVHDLSYLATATLVRCSTVDKTVSCRAGGHAVGLSLGVAILAARFPRKPIFAALTNGKLWQAPWSDGILIFWASSGIAGAVAACAQKACGDRKRA